MRGSLSAAAVAGVIGLSAVVAPGLAAADCDAIFEAAQQARAADDLNALKRTHEAALAEPGCDATFQRSLGSVVATQLLRQAQLEAKQAGGSAAAEPILLESLSYARKWQALAVLGDVASERGQHDAAAGRYQEALEVIQDEQLTPKAPEPTVIAALFDKAQTAGLLSTDYVPAPRTRSGAPAGLGSPQIRGFTVAKVALPITFDFDSTQFDAKGKAAVADLANNLKAEGEPAITLIGHTDPTGADDYNVALSLRRADAVAAYLRASNYLGEISVDGRGEREPFEVDDPGRYNTEQLHRLYRRVEVRR